VKEGKAYAYVEGAEIHWRHVLNSYVFPRSLNSIKEIEKQMLSLFRNGTVYVTKNAIFVEKEIKCPNKYNFSNNSSKEVQKIFVIRNGKKETMKQLCKSCQYMVEELVGDCRRTEYEANDGHRYAELDFELKDEIKDYLEIKKGYIKDNDFSKSIDFSYSNVKERIAYYEKKGQWRKQLNSTRKNICADCVKYKTETCKKGFNGYRTPVKCHYTKDELMDRLRKECLNDFGSLGKALWFFSQCGQGITFKDPNTKRKSLRYVSVPGHPEGKLNAKGFFMAFCRYPFKIGSYGYRHQSYWWQEKKDKDKKYQNYLTLYEYKKKFPEKIVKTRYKKSLEETVLTAYAIYKYCGSSPGQGYGFCNYSNYLTYIGINREDVEVGVGASKWSHYYTVKNLRDLFNKTNLNIEKK